MVWEMRTVLAAFLLSCALVAPCGAEPPQIIVSAAASLTDVLTELQPKAQAFTGAKVLYNFGGSGTLRHQVEQGAPVDVIFSAASEDMDRLQQEGLIIPATRADVLSNSMVLIGSSELEPASGVEDLRALLQKTEFLAIGNPDTVPAGRYAVQVLRTYGLYAPVERKLVLGGTVREVLAYVQSGSAPLGIVFATDALSVKPSSGIRNLFVFPDEALRTPIRYPVGVVSASRNRDVAQKMIDFLKTDPAREAFRRAGFVLE
jgi:molybdate transport system substrate-binding protein